MGMNIRITIDGMDGAWASVEDANKFINDKIMYGNAFCKIADHFGKDVYYHVPLEHISQVYGNEYHKEVLYKAEGARRKLDKKYAKVEIDAYGKAK